MVEGKAYKGRHIRLEETIIGFGLELSFYK